MNENFLDNYQFDDSGGEKLNIIHYPDRILTMVAKEVEQFDEELQTLCLNMLYTMYDAPGIGLAAPQIGKSIRLLVVDPDYTREEISNAEGKQEIRLDNFRPRIMINPVITAKEGVITHEEGCLSLPGIYEEVKRVEKINVEYQDMFGNKHSSEESGLSSICIQHEIDHLDGKVFLDHISLLKRNLYKKKLLKEKKRRAQEE